MAKGIVRRVISFGIAAMALIGAYKAAKHAAKSVKRASEK